MVTEQLICIAKEDMMPQNVIAARTGIAEATISRIFNHKREGNIKTLERIADAMGCEIIVRRRTDK